jgi:peroxiredoxin (alkyl hydroperoxide reductase subunit C)
MKQNQYPLVAALWYFLLAVTPAAAISDVYQGNIFDPGSLKPIDSVWKVKVGDPAPDFQLPSVTGEKVSLRQFRGNKHVVISFVPAAWTPVCSDQWPGYNLVREIFEQNNAVLLGISVDNAPTLFAWTRQMGELWFPVLSDFWPHGAVADSFGVLRSDGTAERAIIMIDKTGTIRFLHVSDINRRPELEMILQELEKMKSN